MYLIENSVSSHISLTFSFRGLEKADVSGFEAPTGNESDITAQEDSSVYCVKKPSALSKISSHSSSFVQKILHEDSCTGLTIIDLFIALKAIKENLELLSQSNENISEHVNFLSEETETVWKDFIELLENMRIFLEKMNTDASVYNLEKFEEKFSARSATGNSYLRQSSEKTKSSDNKIKCACAECGGTDVKDVYAFANKKFTCLGCLISGFKEKSLGQLPNSSEAFLGSVFASILYWQKERERERKPKIAKSASSIFEEEATIRESTVKMIRDICEALNVSAVREREKPPPVQPLIHRGSDPRAFGLKASGDTEDEPGTPMESKQEHLHLLETTAEKLKSGESSREGTEKKCELTSEEESEFEEALTCQLNHPHDMRPRPSVTCMGDLSRAASGKKSASTLTSNNNIISSWVGNLSGEIKSKIKLQKKTNVKLFEQAFEKSEIAPRKTPETLQFSIAANPSAGVFDVTVVQYKNHRYLAKYPKNCKKKVPPELVSNSTRDSHFPLLLKNSKDQSLSEESVVCSESESMETCSNFDDGDMGEFLEIYVEDKNNSDIQEPLSVPGPKTRLHGDLKNMELKIGKTQLMEMHRLYAVFFVQEFLKKTRKIQQNENPEAENPSNDPSEKEEEEIVIECSSSDLVIYIQLEVEDDSGSIPKCLLVDLEKSSLETQTKENDSETSFQSREKPIRLGNNVQKGESLFKVWRTQDTDRISEVKDAERFIFNNKPLVIAEKPEEQEKEERKEKEVKRENKEEEEEQEEERDNKEEKEEERENKEEKEEVKKTLKVLDRANVLLIKDIKQSALVWDHQVSKHWKSEIIRLKKLEVPKEIIESIKSSAGELRKALLLIREIESDIVDAQIDNAISILPRLELELRKHLQTKIRGLETKEIKNRMSVDNIFSSFDLGQRDDSIGGDSDESSECRFNNLLKLLSNLEDAVKTSEHFNNKIELCHYDSSKIYELLHALTDSIRELEEGLNVTSLSRTLHFASRLHAAIKEYDNVVKKQPTECLTQEKSRKRRKPSWSTAVEEASVTKHLKNVRKKVFEMVEMEAVGMEERIERDFDRLDRLGTENDEALMFLEALLQKTQKRMSEFQGLKTELKDLFSTINNLYENFRKVMIHETEEKMEAEASERSLRKTLEKSSSINSESIEEGISKKSSGTIPKRTSNKVSKKNVGRILERTSERIPGIISKQKIQKDLKRKTESALNENLEKRQERSFGKNLERSCSGTTSKRASNRFSERTGERNSRKCLDNSSGKISDTTSERNLERNQERIIETNSERIMEKAFERSLETIPKRTQSRVSEVVEKNGDIFLEQNEKIIIKRSSEKSLNRTSQSLTITSEKFLQDTLDQLSEEFLEKNSERLLEKSTHGSLDRLSERSGRTSGIILEGIHQEEKKDDDDDDDGDEEEAPKNTKDEPLSQESLEQIVSSFINAIDYLKSKSVENKSEDKSVPSSQSFEKLQVQQLANSSTSEPLSSTIKELQVIGQNSLYLSWTEPEGSLEGSITGYEIYVDGKLNQRVRNPQRLQAVLYSVDLSKKIQVQLYAVVENNPKTLLASMDLNGE